MNHVQRLTYSGNVTGPVHAEAAPGVTWCKWVFVTDKSAQGKPVYMAADSKEDVSCLKCMNRMRAGLHNFTADLTPQQVEDILEYAVELTGIGK